MLAFFGFLIPNNLAIVKSKKGNMMKEMIINLKNSVSLSLVTTPLKHPKNCISSTYLVGILSFFAL